MLLHLIRNRRQFLQIETPYTPEEICSILKKNVYVQDPNKCMQRSLVFLNDEPFIGTYDTNGFQLNINPKNASGFTNTFTCCGILYGIFETRNDKTTVHIELTTTLSSLFVMGFSLLFLLFSLCFAFFIADPFAICISSILMIIFSFIGKGMIQSPGKAEDKIRKLFS